MKTTRSIICNQEQLGDLGLDIGIGEPAPLESQPAGLLGGNGGGGGLLGDSLGGVEPQQKREDNMMPEIEDVIEDDNGGLNLPKIEEDSVMFLIVGQREKGIVLSYFITRFVDLDIVVLVHLNKRYRQSNE